MSRRRGPVWRNDDGTFTLDLDEQTREQLADFVSQLASLGEASEGDARLRRLHPDAYHLDPELDEEWKGFMRPELAASRASAIETTRAILAEGGPITEERLHALMRVMNSLRLVLGTLLGIEDEDSDPDDDELDADDHLAAQWALYEFCGWLLEWTVRALEGADTLE